MRRVQERWRARCAEEERLSARQRDADYAGFRRKDKTGAQGATQRPGVERCEMGDEEG